MPLGDGTGPNGMGPRTGRGLGYCNGYNSPRYLKGYGRGFGWGARFGGYAPNVDERDLLKNEIDLLEKNLETMRKRLNQIEKQEDK